jgi:hypothetical protein
MVIVFLTNFRMEVLDREGRLTAEENSFPLGFIAKVTITPAEEGSPLVYFRVKTKYNKSF